MSEKPIWEQLEGEPLAHFQKFLTYRGLGVHRTMIAAYMVWTQERGTSRRGQNSPKYATPSPGWRKAFKDWKWEERAKAFDDHLQLDRDRINRELEEERRRIQLERSREQIEAEWTLRTNILQRVAEMLAHPLYTKAVDADGKTVVLVPAKWAMRDIVPLARLAMDLGRSATGMDTPQLQELQHVTELIRANWLPEEVYEPLAQKEQEMRETAQNLLKGKTVEVEVTPDEDVSA